LEQDSALRHHHPDGHSHLANHDQLPESLKKAEKKTGSASFFKQNRLYLQTLFHIKPKPK